MRPGVREACGRRQTSKLVERGVGTEITVTLFSQKIDVAIKTSRDGLK